MHNIPNFSSDLPYLQFGVQGSSKQFGSGAAILRSDNNHTYFCLFPSSGCPIGCYGPAVDHHAFDPFNLACDGYTSQVKVGGGGGGGANLRSHKSEGVGRTQDSYSANNSITIKRIYTALEFQVLLWMIPWTGWCKLASRSLHSRGVLGLWKV